MQNFWISWLFNINKIKHNKQIYKSNDYYLYGNKNIEN